MLENFIGQVVAEIGIMPQASDKGADVLVVDFVSGDRLEIYPEDWEDTEYSTIIMTAHMDNAKTHSWEGIAVTPKPGQNHAIGFKVGGIVHGMNHRDRDVGQTVPTQWAIQVTYQGEASLIDPTEYTVPDLRSWMGYIDGFDPTIPNNDEEEDNWNPIA